MKNKKSNQTTIIFKYNEKKDFVVVQDSEDRQVTLGSSVSLVDYRSLTLSYATNVLQKVLDAGVKDRFDLTELYIVASINNSYLDVFSSNDADSIFAETIENILVNNNFVEDNINGKIVMFSGGIAIGAVTESFVKANFLNLNNSVARDNLEEFRNKLDLSNNEERNESGAKVVDVFTIRGGDITSLSDEFLEVAELSEVRAFTGVDESNVISSSDAISTSAYEEDDTISIVYQYDDGGNFVAVLNSYDGSSVSTSSDDTDYGNLALSFALNATKGVLNEVENLMGEGKFWAKMGTTKPYMVATMTIGFLNAYEAERDESGDDGALAATMGQTAGGLVAGVLLTSAVVAGLSVAGITAALPVFVGGVAVGMLTDHFMNENFFGGGEVSGNDLLGEWGRNLGLQSEAVAELVGDELLDIYMATGDAMESVKDAYEEGKETVGDALLAASNAYNEFLEAISAISLVKDPLIIDLSGDGLALSSQASSGVLFDMDGDGIAESTGWVTSDADGGDDVFLALDKNGNGNIDSVDELFGNDEMDGFAELSLYDSNSDNIIDVNDAQK